MRLVCLIVVSMLACQVVHASDLNVTLEIPRLNVAEYHRPYVAIWIEREDQSTAANLAVWYQLDAQKEDGREWLKDLRQWWRRSGRSLQMPVDGITGATRPVGQHMLTFKSTDKPLSDLTAGKYNLVVEAVREVGGRELVRIPFQWPAAQKQQASARGTSELGAVSLQLVP